MEGEAIRRVLIIGAGTMGQQIGWQCAAFGHDVVLYDISAALLEDALHKIDGYAAHVAAQGLAPAELCAAARQRITATTDPQRAAQDVDLVSESVPEDPKLKGKVFGQFNSLCPPRTIFTTNTSTLLPSQFAKASGRPQQLLALHFHQPVWSANIVDVMPHKATDPQVTERVVAFAHSIGQIPIQLQHESSGYVFNAMFSAVNREALTLAANGVASVEDIDRAWMGIMKMPLGPFGMMDLVGLDTVWHISDYWARRAFFLRQLKKNADFVRQYVQRGWLGIKSGRGFYSYPNPAFRAPDFISRGTQAPNRPDDPSK